MPSKDDGSYAQGGLILCPKVSVKGGFRRKMNSESASSLMGTGMVKWSQLRKTFFGKMGHKWCSLELNWIH